MRTARVNKNLILYEPKNGIHFGTDALLLAYFMRNWKAGKGVELGIGSGIISLLLLCGNNKIDITGIEIQDAYIKAAEKNISENNLDGRLTLIKGDIKNISRLYEAGDADAVFTNPPYLKVGSGKRNISEEKYIAFHEVFCNINDICGAAKWCLKSGGIFYAVYRPERLAGLFSAMRNAEIEPKKLRFIKPSREKKPSLCLIEGKKHAAEGLIINPDLLIYSDGSHREYSAEMKSVREMFK